MSIETETQDEVEKRKVHGVHCWMRTNALLLMPSGLLAVAYTLQIFAFRGELLTQQR